jgi:uncharacterized metal-binding protein YceD (DUF177 family)
LTSPGDIVFRHACRLGLEGIVFEAARLALPLRPLAALDQEQENPQHPTVKREAEEDWGKMNRRSPKEA